MRKFTIVSVLVIAVLLQSTVFSLWAWMGVKLDLVTIIVIFTGLLYGLVPGSIVGFLGGMLLDYSLGRLIGAGAVSKMLIGGLSGWMAPKIFGEHVVVPPLAVLVGTWIEQTTYLLVANAFGSGLPVVKGFWAVVLPVGLFNVVFSFPIYYAFVALGRTTHQGGLED
ncbi:MAG: rod shape-determining protein MreD [Firmicutes bacterium]|nr:rod shape-determining protein MreD [Bacillota bacterium]